LNNLLKMYRKGYKDIFGNEAAFYVVDIDDGSVVL